MNHVAVRQDVHALANRVVRAPDEFAPTDEATSVFLAGGITNCEPWQKRLAALLAARVDDLVVIDPRRETYDAVAAEQIEWEHRHLRLSTAISFWFTATSVQPMALYELGAWSMTKKPIFVGVERGYERELDVRVQTKLARPDVVVVDDLVALAGQIAAWAKGEREG